MIKIYNTQLVLNQNKMVDNVFEEILYFPVTVRLIFVDKYQLLNFGNKSYRFKMHFCFIQKI